ncbi:BTB/POZ domain-containing protein 6-B [Lepeophtheirus salmonis]|uniref:BTB/POZ domain-containing protein 6-B n=1 Tax=Lepeophtheirus salmonis TaxID=72036 RepID=UPI001AE19C01|nr:BTB/POZ domain-containing protein 6-B-like [Lepeophtheirus salmonis]XP_040575474.1 BTB/POZ domain-containing protein 6-B-like [Lepeophtheirus salmonis]XP_040575480.1 BTB/POZ domain-containing protein 6-B-like [Lepeophtheirus salmonis]XP_040575487.1 BTB/POZ domain-containing protein 6-B-like [Lepeophtheirus salmonis]XP_040575495.1 BTB/POZ domain-containing protein 6-B-like [Lepeophtheirus salmonis]
MSTLILSKMKALFESRPFSDITFLVGENKGESPQNISVHRGVLVSASPIFARMFNEEIKGSNKEEIHVPDVVPSAFDSMLKWIYTDEIELNYENVIPILYCAKKYRLPMLKVACDTYIQNKVKLKDLCEIFYQVRRHEISECQQWIENWQLLDPCDTLTSNSFLRIKDNRVIKDILSINQLDLDEFRILAVEVRWASAQKKENEDNRGKTLREILGPALYSIRFPLLNSSEFVEHVMLLELLNDEEIGSVLKYIYRKKKSDPTNFSTKPRQRQCIRFEMKVVKFLTSTQHSICFKVIKPVKVHGFGVFRPIEVNTKLRGTI